MITMLYASRYSDQIVDDYGDCELDYPTDPDEADELIALGMTAHTVFGGSADVLFVDWQEVRMFGTK